MVCVWTLNSAIEVQLMVIRICTQLPWNTRNFADMQKAKHICVRYRPKRERKKCVNTDRPTDHTEEKQKTIHSIASHQAVLGERSNEIAGVNRWSKNSTEIFFKFLWIEWLYEWYRFPIAIHSRVIQMCSRLSRIYQYHQSSVVVGCERAVKQLSELGSHHHWVRHRLRTFKISDTHTTKPGARTHTSKPFRLLTNANVMP